MAPQFAILEHHWNGVHWDFLLERDGTLRTWAVDAPIRAGEALPARELPNHRLVYLDYEGAISGDRGTVHRTARGTYVATLWSDDRVEVTLSSPQLSGNVILSRTGGPSWSFLLAPGKVD